MTRVQTSRLLPQIRSASRRDRRTLHQGPRSTPWLEVLEDRTLLSESGVRFVQQLYRDVLRREADHPGLASWINVLDQGATREQVALAFTSSPENQRLQVRDAYRAFLHRRADTLGVDRFATSLSLGSTLAEVKAVILGSAEYYGRRAGNTNLGFLTALYQDVLHRALDPVGRAEFGRALAHGAARQDVAARVLGSAEAQSEMVQGWYRRYLVRAADAGGLTAFVSAFGQGRNEREVFSLLVGSSEYWARSQGPQSGPGTLNALTLDAALTNDTAPGGKTNEDGLTFDPTISGTVGASAKIVSFRANFSLSKDFVDILKTLKPDGTFLLDRDRLEVILGGPLTDTQYTLYLEVQDDQQKQAAFTVVFTLDTQAPSARLDLSGTVYTAVRHVEAFYNEPVDTAAFQTKSYELRPAKGQPVELASVTERNPTTARVELAALLTDGDYVFTIQPAVSDLAGNPMPKALVFPFTLTVAPRITELSPAQGEEMVSLTRETIVYFDNPIDPKTVTADAFHLIANSKRLLGNIRVSATERFATYFPIQPLPAATEVRLVVDGNMILGRNGVSLDADGDGTPGGRVTANFRTLPLTRIAGTEVWGYVFDSYNEGRPVVGATIRVDAFPEANAVTDDKGYFILRDMPAPEFFVHIDGSTAKNPPPGTVYPVVGKPFHSVPGESTQIMMDGQPFDIFLPPMSMGDLQKLAPDKPTDVSFGPGGRKELIRMFPKIDPATWDRMVVRFPPNSAIDERGNPAKEGIIIPVPPDRIPAPLAPGLTPPLVISIQAPGATNFDVPAPVTFPNLEKLAPGTKTGIYSFNHDAGRWEVNGLGTVSEDGLVIVSDAEVGIRAPGWHAIGPQPQGPPPPPRPPCRPDSAKLDCLHDAGKRFGVCMAAVFATALIPGGAPYAAVLMATCVANFAIEVNACNRLPNCVGVDGASSLGGCQTSGSFAGGPGAEGDPIADQLAAIAREMSDLMYPHLLKGQAPPPQVEKELGRLADRANAIAGGDAAAYMRALSLRIEREIALLEESKGNAPSYPVLYAALVLRNNGQSLTLRGHTQGDGQFNLFVPTDGTLVAVSFYDPRTNSFGTITPNLRPGVRFSLPRFYLQPVDGRYIDTDKEGLPDLVEFVYGTRPGNPDTDGDGINDWAEIQQGLDPLGGRGFPTGIISSLPLLGEAKEIVVEGSPLSAERQTAFVATGSYGLAIVEASRFNNPIILGQIALPGDAVDVAFESRFNVVVVAGNTGGLHFVDVADPMLPRLIRTLNVAAAQVEVVDGIVYAAVGSTLHSFDVLTGERFESLNLTGGAVRGMTRAGTTLYTMDANRILRAVDVSGIQMVRRGQLTMPQGAGKLSVSYSGDRLIAYVAAIGSYFRGGFGTADVTNPDNLSLISGSDVLTPFVAPGTAVVANGSGIGVVIGTSNGAMPSLDLLDISDPQETNVFLTRILLPTAPLGVALGSGIAFVADGSRGVQVINYLPFDAKGRAPTISVSSPVAGDEVVEGSSIPIRVLITDDVQVRNVQLVVNDQVVANDVATPFEFFAPVPTLSSGVTKVTIRARAFDTGGNAAFSNELSYTIVRDTVAPAVVSLTPSANGVGFFVSAMTVRFNEAIDPARVNLGGITLTNLGPDGVLGGNDDRPVLLRGTEVPSERRLTILTRETLPYGKYQLVVMPAVVTDRAGNPLAAPITLTFTNYELDPNTVVWLPDNDGVWNNSANWNTGAVPGANNDVVIDRIGVNLTITHTTGTTTVRSLRSQEAFTISGSSVTMNGTSQVTGTLTVGNRATLTASGPSASFENTGSVNINGGSLQALNGASVRVSAMQSYTGPSGTAAVFRATVGGVLDLGRLTSVSSGGGIGGGLRIEATGGGRVNLSGVTELRTAPGGLPGEAHPVVVLADGAGSVVDLSASTSFADSANSAQSSMEARNGGAILASNLQSFSRVALLLNPTGSLPTRQITTFTGGTVTVNNTAADLSGMTSVAGSTFTLNNGGTADLRNAATINGAGFIVNAGVTLTLPAAQPVYTGPNGRLAVFRAAGAGSVLDLSRLTSVSSGGGIFAGLSIEAAGGGRVNLAGVTELRTAPGGLPGEAHPVVVFADGAGSVVDLSAATSFADSANSAQSSMEARNGGTVLLTPGTLTISRVQFIVTAGTPISVGALQISSGSVLTGRGTLVANVANAGQVNPGGTTAGALTIQGNYTQAAGGVLNMQVGGLSPGTQFDQLNTTGVATLGGTLNLTLINPFRPSLGDSFRILTFGSLSGTFTTVNGTNLGGGLRFDVEYNATDVTLTVRDGGGSPGGEHGPGERGKWLDLLHPFGTLPADARSRFLSDATRSASPSTSPARPVGMNWRSEAVEHRHPLQQVSRRAWESVLDQVFADGEREPLERSW